LSKKHEGTKDHEGTSNPMKEESSIAGVGG
jgi:hypothetical protein